MTVGELLNNVYSDDDYTLFINTSAQLFVDGLITEDEFLARVKAVDEKIKQQ